VLVPERVTLPPKESAELLATPFRVFAPLVVQFEPEMVPPVSDAPEIRPVPLPVVVHEPELVLVPESVTFPPKERAELLATPFRVFVPLAVQLDPAMVPPFSVAPVIRPVPVPVVVH
jgi:hypothetical protein